MESLKKTVIEIMDPIVYKKLEKLEKNPLYLPKYSVRFILLLLLVLILVINNIVLPNPLSFQATDTLADLLTIILFFVIGGIFRGFSHSREKNRIKTELNKKGELNTLSRGQILEYILDHKSSWLKKKGKNLFSIIILVATILGLAFYTVNSDMTFNILPFYVLSLRETLI